MLLLPQTVLPISAPPIPDGAVRVEGNRVTAVGPARDLPPLPGEEVVRLPGCVLAPGFINAHCHLDYTLMRGAISPPDNFVDWIKNINAMKRQFGPDDYRRAISKGFGMLVESGTTTVLNIESFPELLPVMDTPPIRCWWFLELIDVRNKLYDETSLAGALAFFEERRDWLGGFGLSPHAPYTTSIELYRLAKRCCDHYGMPMTTHVAESLPEQEMFSHASGELHRFMASLGRDNSDCGQGSAFSHLFEHGVLSDTALLVHMNYLHEYDFKTLAERRYSIAYCPKSSAYFGHRKIDLTQLLDLDVNVCLGTDSLASNNTLDLRAEIRLAQKEHPHISSEQWLRMATVNAAKALGLDGQLGCIVPGAYADLMAFKCSVKNANPYESVLSSTAPPHFLLVNGETVLSDKM